MNHSIATADRTTHLKIVVLALIGATLVASVGIASRVTQSVPGPAANQLKADLHVMHIGGPVVVSANGTTTIR